MDTGMVTKVVGGIILSIIGLVIVLNIVSNNIGDVQSAGDELNQSNLCAAAGCSYNATEVLTGVNCYKYPVGNETCPTGEHNPPLNSLFAGSGVLILLLMASIFIGLYLYVVKNK